MLLSYLVIRLSWISTLVAGGSSRKSFFCHPSLIDARWGMIGGVGWVQKVCSSRHKVICQTLLKGKHLSSEPLNISS